ncbi:MAG: anaerobic ribonucleoside-triphosphate reductase activating protein [Candidatus Hydrothermarchaeota archaeon]|nr:MAG: anaerobic ribonucleoside-triphosphate reductase activating protein [Candidatus Hydrothermarchaeota archaeon]
MLIKGFQRVSLIEYPGKIVSIVFVGGCNFRCHYCYNTDLVLNYRSLPDIPEDDIIDFMESRKGLLDGVAITGGEPTLCKDLPEFARKIKNMDFLVMIETNGSNPRMIKELIDKKLVDYIAMDIKAPLEKYDEVAGVKVNRKKIQESIDVIKNSGVDYEFRTTVVPRFFKRDDALAIGKWLKGSKRYFLQQFRPGKTLDKKLKRMKPYPPEKLKEFAELVKPFFEYVGTRGI